MGGFFSVPPIQGPKHQRGFGRFEQWGFEFLFGAFFFILLWGCKGDGPKDAEGSEGSRSDMREAPSECVPEKEIRNDAAVQAYTDSLSFYPGDPIRLYVHSKEARFRVELIHERMEQDTLAEKLFENGKRQDHNDCSYKKGFGWDPTGTFKLPDTLVSGYYSLRLSNDSGDFHIPFVVKDRSHKPVTVLASTFTWQAYNAAGSASFYRYNLERGPEGKEKASFISLERPMAIYDRFERYQASLFQAELALPHWLDAKEVPYRVISDLDLHRRASELEGSDVFILNAHPEYWSKSMYDHLEAYLEEGGDLMYLGGNGIYWKVTLQDGRLECQKQMDPHLQDGSPGGKWRNLDRHETGVLGVRYTPAGANTSAPYICVRPDHWIFEGTGLEKGALFGKSLNQGWASGHETDKILQKEGYTPEQAELLAKGLNKERLSKLGAEDADQDGGAHMLHYEHEGGGHVFSAGSITYTGALLKDTAISRLTHNVLDSLTELDPKKFHPNTEKPRVEKGPSEAR